jgi:hypothetical protein
MHQEQNRQKILLKLIELGYLDANIRVWNRQAVAAFECFKSGDNTKNINNFSPFPVKSSDLFTQNIIHEMVTQGFYLSRGLNRNNIIYIRNCNLDGLSVQKNEYNYTDLRVILVIEHDGNTHLKGCWRCTIDGGTNRLLTKKLNKETYKIVTPQQVWAWNIGVNNINSVEQEGLVQLRPVAIEKLNEEKQPVLDFKNLGLNQNGSNPGKVGKFYSDALALSLIHI